MLMFPVAWWRTSSRTASVRAADSDPAHQTRAIGASTTVRGV